jgi:hypothetical protein
MLIQTYSDPQKLSKVVVKDEPVVYTYIILHYIVYIETVWHEFSMEQHGNWTNGVFHHFACQSGRDAYLCAEYLWDDEYYVQVTQGSGGPKLRSLGHLRHVCLTVPHDIKDNIIFLVASLVTNDISAEFLGCRNRKWVETINIHESNCPWFDFYIVIDMIYIYNIYTYIYTHIYI